MIRLCRQDLLEWDYVSEVIDTAMNICVDDGCIRGHNFGHVIGSNHVRCGNEIHVLRLPVERGQFLDPRVIRSMHYDEEPVPYVGSLGVNFFKRSKSASESRRKQVAELESILPTSS